MVWKQYLSLAFSHEPRYQAMEMGDYPVYCHSSADDWDTKLSSASSLLVLSVNQSIWIGEWLLVLAVEHSIAWLSGVWSV